MISPVITFKGMLDVLCNSGVYVTAGRLICTERSVKSIYVRIFKISFSSFQSSAVTDVLINIIDFQKP